MKTKIVITLEGGLIQEVLANEDVDVLILNYDTEEYDGGVVVPIPFMIPADTSPFKSIVFHPQCHFENITVDHDETERIIKIVNDNI